MESLRPAYTNRMRKFVSIAGAVAGLVYTAWRMAIAYSEPHPEGIGTIVFQFFVFSIFTVPLGAAVGLGIGLLLDGLVKRK